MANLNKPQGGEFNKVWVPDGTVDANGKDNYLEGVAGFTTSGSAGSNSPTPETPVSAAAGAVTSAALDVRGYPYFQWQVTGTFTGFTVTPQSTLEDDPLTATWCGLRFASFTSAADVGTASSSPAALSPVIFRPTLPPGYAFGWIRFVVTVAAPTGTLTIRFRKSR